MNTRTVTGVRPQQWPVGSGWVVDLIREDGMQWCYPIPSVALWGRAAEYGIDPADAETLLDVVLQEIVMTDYGQSPAQDDPSFVYNTDEASAWTAHQARIRAAKDTVAHVDPGGHLKTICEHHAASLGDPAHRAFYEQHRATVADVRSRRRDAASGRES